MKAMKMAILVAALGLSAPVALAEESHHTNAPAVASKDGTKAEAAAIGRMQDNAKKMQAQIDKIAKTKDAKERQRLLQEHMQTMQDSMMQGKQAMMMDCPMMGGQGGMGMMGQGGMGMMMGGQGGQGMGGPAMGGQGGMGPDAMMERMQKMEQRMDMMQQMLQKGGMAVPAK